MQQITPANYRFKREMIGERIVGKIGARRRSGCSAPLRRSSALKPAGIAATAAHLGTAHLGMAQLGGCSRSWRWPGAADAPRAGPPGQGAPRGAVGPPALGGGCSLEGTECPLDPGRAPQAPSAWAERASPAASRPPTHPANPPTQKLSRNARVPTRLLQFSLLI